MNKKFLKNTLALTLSSFLLISSSYAASTVSSCTLVKADLASLANGSGISVSDLKNALSMAVCQQKIIDAMNRPAEKKKKWWEYRKIFITTSKINAGVNFYQENLASLKRAEILYGVPPEIVCAIIGVETSFGKNMGSWKVLDALYTLGFNYPPRAKYFSKEFAQFVALCKRENWSLTSVNGSYAGAMGMGQFMPTAYLDNAIDFDGDGKVNLFTDKADAIGSVANYFKMHGWEKGRGIYYPANVSRCKNVQQIIDKKWDLTARELYQSGITTKVNISQDQNIRLFAFELEDGTVSYSVGLDNFHAIMRYNTSQMYARAVYELSEFIRMGYEKKQNEKGIATPPKGRRP